jgi:hypothetical protein
MSEKQFTEYELLEEAAIARAVKAQRLTKGTSNGPWVRWKGCAHVMQGPAIENTSSSFRGGGKEGTIAECDHDVSERKARKNAELMAQSRTLLPKLAEDVVYLSERLFKYRSKLAAFIRNNGVNAETAELAFMLESDGESIGS